MNALPRPHRTSPPRHPSRSTRAARSIRHEAARRPVPAAAGPAAWFGIEGPIAADTAQAIELGGSRTRSRLESSLLFAKYQGLVGPIVAGFQRRLPRHVSRDDLLSAGLAGLWDAIQKHGHEQTERFAWYVKIRIRGAIVDELRAQDWLPRRARAAATQEHAPGLPRATTVVLLDDVSDAEHAESLATRIAPDGEEATEHSWTRARLAEAVEQLPERERYVVAMHYFRDVKFKELGLELGVSEPRISQLHSRAMQRLRALLQEAA